MPATLATVRQLALALPDVTEGTSYGTPGFYVRKKLMLRLWEDGEVLVAKVDLRKRAALMNQSPDVFFVTAHYRDHPYVLINLLHVNDHVLRGSIVDAWHAASPGKSLVARPERVGASRPADALTLLEATPDDAIAIAALRNAVADHLTARYGQGWWSGHCTDQGVRFDLRVAKVFVARQGATIIGTLKLASRKPWAIDRKYFTPAKTPLYLTSMAVLPEKQRQGLGRRCLAEAVNIARAWPAGAICLDAFDHAAGAGGFYRKCGFREVGRNTYRRVPLVYFELLV